MMMRAFDRDNPLAIEIQQEMAASYFTACKRMVDSLEAVKAFDRSHPPAKQTREESSRRSALVDEAGERVHFVIIQREAMQLLDTDQFFGDYGISAEIKERLRPRQSR